MQPVTPTSAGHPPAGAERAAPARGALAGLSLAMLLPSLGTSIANVGLPTLAEAFHAPFQQVQWVVLAYLLAVTTSIVGAGRLGDMMGRRRLLLAGIALYGAASVLAAGAPTLGLLIAARAAQGVGAAFMMALTMALAGAAVPPAQTGRAMGLLGTTSALGTALGPSLGGVLIAGFGWPAIFLVNVPLGLLALALVRGTLAADRLTAPPDLRRFDVGGTLWLALTLAAYALAMTAGPTPLAAQQVALLIAAGFGAVLFVRAQARAASPLIPVGMLRDRRLALGLAMSALVSTVMMATLVVGPFYLARALGLEAAMVGLAMSVGPLVAALGGVPAGRAVETLGAPRMTAVGLFGMAAGALLLAGSGAHDLAGYLAPVAVITAGYAAFQTANNTAVMDRGGPEQRGVMSGLLNLSRNLGLITGASVMGAVFAAATGALDVTAAPPDAMAAGMRTTFAVAATLLGSALALAMAGRATATPPARLGDAA